MAHPKLPVPELRTTCDNFLRFAEPLASKSDYNELVQLAEEFCAAGGDGEYLQKKLLERAASTTNWLEEWYIYHHIRNSRVQVDGCCVPLVPLARPHPQLPRHDVRRDVRFNGLWRAAVASLRPRVAARIIFKLRLYWEHALAGQVPPLMMGKQALDMYQSSHLLGVCRVPAEGVDRIVEAGAASRHILIAHRDQFFVFPLYDGERPLTMGQIESQLRRIKHNHHREAQPSFAYQSIGMLTNAHRDKWAEVYAKMQSSPINRDSFDKIHAALAVICLDQTSPLSSTARLNNAVHGGGSHVNSGNRWMDKSYTITVAENGESGAAIEHTIADGLPFFHMASYTLSHSHILEEERVAERLPHPEHLQWEIDDDIDRTIEDVSASTDALIRNFDFVAEDFTKFGKAALKVYNLSPDGFFQMAIQLAFFRDQKSFTTTYESGHTLMFQHGRTETIRPVSKYSVAMVKAIEEVPRDVSACAGLVKKAITSHGEAMKMALTGKGPDRHLLGLRMLAAQNGRTPKLFSHKAFADANRFRLSSSYNNYQGFGPVVADGYGVCYSTNLDDKLTYSVSSFVDCELTDSTRFAARLQQALSDLLEVVAADSMQSKL